MISSDRVKASYPNSHVEAEDNTIEYVRSFGLALSMLGPHDILRMGATSQFMAAVADASVTAKLPSIKDIEDHETMNEESRKTWRAIVEANRIDEERRREQF